MFNWHEKALTESWWGFHYLGGHLIYFSGSWEQDESIWWSFWVGGGWRVGSFTINRAMQNVALCCPWSQDWWNIFLIRICKIVKLEALWFLAFCSLCFYTAHPFSVAQNPGRGKVSFLASTWSHMEGGRGASSVIWIALIPWDTVHGTVLFLLLIPGVTSPLPRAYLSQYFC